MDRGRLNNTTYTALQCAIFPLMGDPFPTIVLFRSPMSVHGCHTCSSKRAHELASAEIDEWEEHGPYTMVVFVGLCKVVTAIPEDVRDLQLEDTIREVGCRFPPAELRRLFNAAFAKDATSKIIKDALSIDLSRAISLTSLSAEQLDVVLEFESHFDMEDVLEKCGDIFTMHNVMAILKNKHS